jgi:hypothetical protein
MCWLIAEGDAANYLALMDLDWSEITAIRSARQIKNICDANARPNT